MQIKKAVITAAGRGVRLYPAADTVQKGMLPILDRDGLAKPVLEKAMTLGYAPTLKHWLDSGSHSLIGWETDLSSQTSASQAGLLHGNNYNILAFRWYDRERRKIVATGPGRQFRFATSL